MKGTNLKEIPLEQLEPHPANPNKMSKSAYAKLVANIKKTGLYEPIVVRPLGDKFQIINGHHRVEALWQLGAETASAVVWELDDRTTLTLLASLNRLTGTDEPEKKSRLYAELLASFSAKDLAKILPCSATQLERLACVKLPDVPSPAVVMPDAVVFFLTSDQRTLVETALAKAKCDGEKGEKGEKSEKSEKSSAKKNAAALTLLAKDYIENSTDNTGKSGLYSIAVQPVQKIDHSSPDSIPVQNLDQSKNCTCGSLKTVPQPVQKLDPKRLKKRLIEKT